jgi:hypothetical protein
MGVQRRVKTCRELLEGCGAKTKTLVWEMGGESVEHYHGEFVYGCKYSEACAFVKSGFEWRWVDGWGLEVHLSGEGAMRNLLEGFRRLAGGWMGNGAEGVGADRSIELVGGGALNGVSAPPALLKSKS